MDDVRWFVAIAGLTLLITSICMTLYVEALVLFGHGFSAVGAGAFIGLHVALAMLGHGLIRDAKGE